MDLATVCVSPKSAKPPPSEGVTYRLGARHPEEVNQLLSRVLEMARDLQLEKFYKRIPIPDARREHTIAQLAIWMELGKQSNRPQDAITTEGIKEELVKQAGVKAETLPPDQQKELERGVQSIFTMTDLTLKASLSVR